MKELVLDRWRSWSEALILAAIFVSPLIFNRNTVDVFNLTKITVLWIFGLLALVFFVGWSAERRIWPPRFRIGIAALVFLGACAVATAFSENPVLSVTGLYQRYGGLLPFMLYAGFMLVIVGLYWEDPKSLRNIAKASAAASLVMTVYALVQAAGLDMIEWVDASGNPPPYPVSTMGNSNFAGGYLGIGIPFVAYLALTARREGARIFWMVVLAADFLALWFTQTRGGMIAGGVGMVTFVFLHRHRLPRWIKAGTSVAVIAGLIVSVLTLADVGGLRSKGALGEVETLRTGTFTIRTFYWGTAWRIFLDHPVVGTGLETYYANYPKYRLAEDGRTLGLTITDKPHNIFLEYAANAGILGAGSYLAMLGLAIFFGMRALRRLDGHERLLCATFISVLTGYMGQGVFSIDVPPIAVMGWIALGGIAALADPRILKRRDQLAEEQSSKRSKRKRDREARRFARPAQPGPSRWPAHVGLIVAVLALGAVGVRPVLADFRAKDAQVGGRAPEAALEDYEKAIGIFGLEPSYYALSGGVLESQAAQENDPVKKVELYESARKQFQAALDLQPGNIFYMMNLGRLLGSWGAIDVSKFDEADKWWSRAVERDPTDWAMRERFALFLNDWANAAGRGDVRLRTAEQLEKLVEINPEHGVGWLNLGKMYNALGRRSEAIDAVEEALKQLPGNEEAIGLLADWARQASTTTAGEAPE